MSSLLKGSPPECLYFNYAYHLDLKNLCQLTCHSNYEDALFVLNLSEILKMTGVSIFLLVSI